jgi:hypothetical protein|nr:MAG TPA: hypothetical protein [Caudoviricetes sp.]
MAVKTVKLLVETDLHTDDFEVRNGKLRTRKLANTYPLLYATGKDRITTWNPVDYNNNERHKLRVVNGFGKIHLDFKAVTDVSGAIFKLPDNAPKNLDLIEAQTHDGSSIWLNAGNKTIYSSGLKAGTRYIVDIIGFFE